MKQINNYLHSKFVCRIAVVFVVAMSFFSTGLALAVYSPIDYFQITYEPAIFSKTEITNGEVFNATIKSRGIAIKDPPSGAEAVRFSYRYIANNKASGEEQILNPFYSVAVEPFPQKKGETYETSNKVPLQFPTESQAGDYTIIEEIINIEMKDSGFGWQDAPKPSKPPKPIKPSAPTQPSAPTKPSKPTKPSAPSQPSGPGGEGTEPSRPPKPSRPPEPSRPGEPSRPPEPTAPSAPRREIGTVKYSPELAPSSILTVSALAVSPPSVIGGATSVGTVTLNEPAHAGDIVVPLSATPSTSVTLPASITVKAGKTSGTFKILTKAVTSPVDATITATLNNSQKTASLTVTPPTCRDTDNGKNYAVKGSVTATAAYGGLFGNDHCQGDIELNEYYCLDKPNSAGGLGDTVTYKCPNGCKDGACLPASIPPLLSLTVSPASVVGGATSTGTVTLSGPAPAGGQVVRLSATPRGFLTLPASVIVKAGETSGTFDAHTKKLVRSVKVTIKATLKKSQKTAGLTINPPTVSALTVSPPSVIGGATSVGTVTLNGPAPARGYVVKLSTPRGVPLTFPTSVTVKAGETSGSFKILTKAVTSPVDVIITASLQRSQKTAVLTIMPPTVSTKCGDNLVDSRDGKIYSTVQIGDQCWMSQNLDYDNGCSAKTFESNTDVGWCGYYTGGPFTNDGLLYQWSAATNNSCPTGWHLATHDEWITLERTVCTSSSCAADFPYGAAPRGFRGTNEGTALRTGGTSGFNALITGYRDGNGPFLNRSKFTFFWTSTKINNRVWFHDLESSHTDIHRSDIESTAPGFSVRCLKD